MEKLSVIEKTAVDLVRGAGRYGVSLSQLGFEVTGVADWLESQIPRLRDTVTAVARAAVAELARQDGLPQEHEKR